LRFASFPDKKVRVFTFVSGCQWALDIREGHL